MSLIVPPTVTLRPAGLANSNFWSLSNSCQLLREPRRSLLLYYSIDDVYDGCRLRRKIPLAVDEKTLENRGFEHLEPSCTTALQLAATDTIRIVRLLNIFESKEILQDAVIGSATKWLAARIRGIGSSFWRQFNGDNSERWDD